MKRRHEGFSLIELMIVLALAAIILVIGVPSFNSIIQNNRIISQANEFISALNIARSEAVNRGEDIILTDSSGDVNWDGGWTIDTAGGTRLRDYSALQGNITLQAQAGVTSITFRADGMTTLASGTTRTFDLCDSGRTGETGRRISILNTGRISIADLNCL